MRHGQFERPTAHYDERLKAIDEQLCTLINERKELAKNPGFPTEELTSAWANKYGFHEEFLHALFGYLLEEDSYRPMIEPKVFIKNIPVLKSFEKADLFYLVSFIRQYENASVVNFTMYRDVSEDTPGEFVHHHFLDLSIVDGKGTDYTCQNNGGGGSDGQMSVSYVISPPLPDDLVNIQLVFKKESTHLNNEADRLEFAVELGN